METQRAQEADLEQIIELQKLCYHENAVRYNDFTIAPLVQGLSDLEKDLTSIVILKVESDSIIIGSIRAFEKNGTCFIGRVIVHPDFQNKGIGAKLMSAIEAEFKYVNRFELFTGFRDEKNLYFYNKLGYKEFKQEQIKEDLSMIYFEKMNHCKP